MRDARAPDAARLVRISCEINGRPVTLEAYPMARLLDVLREQVKLTGTKEGCGEGECGACSIEIDGLLVNSCLVPFVQAEGAKIRTIEGLAVGNFVNATASESQGAASTVPDAAFEERLHAVQQAFLLGGGAQCGICTPGMILATVNLLQRNPNPSEAEIREGLSGNLCRCTGYTKIVASVVAACKAMPGSSERGL
jgi:carbon-monoxide dehydrogenase small subunit